MKKAKHLLNGKLSGKILSGLLALLMVFGLFAGFAPTVSYAENGGGSLTEDEANALLAGAGTSLVQLALENGLINYDTVNGQGGSGHMQGICVDDKLEYMYFSYTDALVKVDMRTGKVVGSVGGFGKGSFGTSGGAHLGCLEYYDGWVYGSLEYKAPGAKFFVCAIDTSMITEIGMDMKDDAIFGNGGVNGILLKEPTEDFRDPLNYGKAQATNGGNDGHRFGCSGIDGITFGKMPGDPSGEIYMILAYGVYGGFANRYDDRYNVLQFYKLTDIWDTENHKPTGTQNIRFTYERGLSQDYTEEEVLSAADTLYVWTGNTEWGSQNLEYEWDTGNIVLYTYGTKENWGLSYQYVVDGSKAPRMLELEVGQSAPSANADARERAQCYMVDTNDDGTPDAYPIVKHAVLKCVCGDESKHDAATVGDAEWGDSGIKKSDRPICSIANPATATYGIHWLGQDPENPLNDYFYIANGSYTAGLYKRTEDPNTGKWTYTKATPQMKPVEKTKLVHLSMDVADLYEKNGVVYMKNSADPTGANDAIVEGTLPGAGVNGGAGSSLTFDAWQYPARVDQVKLSSATIDLINTKIQAAQGNGTYSYSFWYKVPNPGDTDGNFLPVLGFYREDGTYANIIQHRWRDSLGNCINGIGSATVGAGNISANTYNPSNGNPGDNSIYIRGVVNNSWHHIVVTEAAGDVKIYVDGAYYGKNSADFNHLQKEPFTDFIIGGGKGKVWQDMNNRGRLIGSIDDVQIWSGVLTDEDVAAMYAAKPADAAISPDHPGVVTEEPNTNIYAAYNLTVDEGKDVTVDTGVAVTSVAGLTQGTDYTADGTRITFKAAWLAGQTAGRHTVTFNGDKAITLTVTDTGVPVLNYSFNKGAVTGTSVKDLSVYQVDAIANNISVFGADHSSTNNGAVFFNGYDYDEPTYIKLGSHDADWLNSVLKSGYTFSFWANAGAENGTRMILAGLYGADGRHLGVLETNDGDNSNANIDGLLKLQVNVAKSDKTAQEIKNSGTVNKEEWAMYTVSYDKASNTVKLYVNGAAVASSAVADDIIGNIDQLFIGHQFRKYYHSTASRDWTTRGGFYGYMDSFVVYDYALTPEEVSALYGSGTITPAEKTKPILHWSMDANTLSGDGTIRELAGGYTSYYQNVTPVAGVDGKEGGALYFNGAADSGEEARVWLGEEGIAEINKLIGDQVTMTFWMKADTTATNEQLAYTAAWSPVAGIYGTDTRFLMVAEYRGGTQGTLNYCATIPGLKDQRINKGVISPANGEWNFVVMTWDGQTTETVGGTASVLRRIYIFKADGTVVVGTPDRAATASNANTKALFDSIGHIEVGGQNSKGFWSDTNVRGRFVGAIDDLKVYNIPFTQAEAVAMQAIQPVTDNELYLPEYQFEVTYTDAADLAVAVENAGALTSVSGLTAQQYSFANGVLTLKHDALVALGAGKHLLTLTFANGTRVIRVTVVDDRVYFTAPTAQFDKKAPADITFTAEFGSAVEAVSGHFLSAGDYTVDGRTVTVKAGWLSAQQPGGAVITVTADNGETHEFIIHVLNTAAADGSTALPYPVLYYKFDGADLVPGEPPVNGAAAGIIKDRSGNGIDLLFGGLTRTDKNKDGTADSSTFFDGFRDYDVSRAWLDEAGMDYLNEALTDEITISFWHASPRITSNYMPVVGLYDENDRPLVMFDFRTSGDEREGAGQTTAPSIVAVPDGSYTLTDGELKASSTVTMNSTWHHYAVTYNNKTGAAVLYVDGVQKASGTLPAGQLDDAARFEIGGMVNAGYYKLSSSMGVQSHGRLYGDLDELRVYNVILSADDVSDLYGVDVDDVLPVDTTGIRVLTGTADSSGVRVKVDVDLAQDALLIVAQYSGEQLVGVQLFSISADGTYDCTELTCSGDGSFTYRAFLVDSGYVSMCPDDSF